MHSALVVLALAAGALSNPVSFIPHFVPTPIMGWSSWNAFHGDIDEWNIRNTSDAMVKSGLRDAGFVFVNLDDNWSNPTRVDGKLEANQKTFPSGMAALVEYIRGNGMKAGTYTDRGTKSCMGTIPGLAGHEATDAATFAGWGFQSLKVDDCNIPQGQDAATEYGLIFEELRKAAPSLADGIVLYVKASDPVANATLQSNSRRGGHDISPSFSSMWSLVEAALPALPFTHPSSATREGFFLNIDMAEIGNGDFATVCPATDTHWAMWCAMKSHLILGNNILTLTPDINAFLTNPEPIAINQDPLGIPVSLVASPPSPSNVTVGSPLQATTCSSSSPAWEVSVSSSPGAIKHAESGLCAALNDCQGGQLVLAECSGGCDAGYGAEWVQGSGGSLVSAANHDCMDVYDFNGPVVQAYKCNGGTNQQWSLPSSTGPVKNPDKNLCLTVGASSQTAVFAGPIQGGKYTAVLANPTAANVTITLDFSVLTAVHPDAAQARLDFGEAAQLQLDGFAQEAQGLREKVIRREAAQRKAVTSAALRDVLNRKDLGVFQNSFSANVPAQGSVFLLITPQ